MEKYIKYKRICKFIEYEDDFQKLFDGFIEGGWDIIHYQEEKPANPYYASVTIVVGKRQDTSI